MHARRKWAILAVSMLHSIINGISPILADIQVAYPHVPKEWILQLMSLPMLITVPVALLCDSLTLRIPKKRLLLIGVGLTTVFGLMPLLLENFVMLLLSRLLLGVGVGLVIPFMTGMIVELFPSDERNILLGLQGTFVNMGSILYSVLGGLLGAILWRLNFLIYGIGIVIFLLVWLNLPEPGKSVRHKENRSGISLRIWLITLCMFVIAMTGFSFVTQISFVLKESNFGSPVTAGLILMVNSAGGFTSGLVFGKLLHIARKQTLSLAWLLSGIGFLTFGLTQSVLVMCFAGFLVGFSLSLSISALLTEISDASNHTNTTLAMGIFMSSISLGGFANAWFIIIMESLPFIKSIRDILIAIAALYLISAVLHAAGKVGFRVSAHSTK